VIREEGLRFHLILNAYWESLNFQLPDLRTGSTWRLWVDTALDSPHDITPWEQSLPMKGHVYRVADRSVVMLYSNSEEMTP
jgi:isoamylase